ncbi:MAG: hypothetical protein ACO1RX_01600 [Candidatus Sericytochromatia bacterium]
MVRSFLVLSLLLISACAPASVPSVARNSSVNAQNNTRGSQFSATPGTDSPAEEPEEFVDPAQQAQEDALIDEAFAEKVGEE